MLDYKIQYLLGRRDEYMSKFMAVLSSKLELYGKADFIGALYLDMLFSTLTLTFLGQTQRLELYKKLVDMLRKVGLNTRIPEPISTASGYSLCFIDSDAPGLDETGIVNLSSSLIKLEGDIVEVYAPSMQVMYFCYPATYSDIHTIVDQNNFNVTNGWSMRILTLTVDGQPVDYKVYESNNLTTLNNYNITFKL